MVAVCISYLQLHISAKFSGLKTLYYSFYGSCFGCSWVRLGASGSGSHVNSVKVASTRYQLNCSSRGLRRGDSPSVVRPQIFTGWLLARDTSTLPCGPLRKVAYNAVSFPQNEESESPQERRQSFYNFICWHPITLSCFTCFKWLTVSTHSRGGGCTSVKMRRWGILGAISEALPSSTYRLALSGGEG